MRYRSYLDIQKKTTRCAWRARPRASIYQALITQVVADIEAPTATAPAKVDRVMPRHDPMGIGISLHLATVDLLGNIGGAVVSIHPATCTVDSLATTLDSNGVVTQPGDLCKSVIGAGSTDEKNTVPFGVGCAIKRLDHKCDAAFCGHNGAWLGGVCASTMVGGISNLATSTSSIIGALDIFNPDKPLSATNVPLGTNLSSVAPILSEQAVERVETAATAILSTAVATAVVSSVVSVEKERAGVHFSMSADQHGLGVDERLTQALNKAVSHYPCLSIDSMGLVS